MSLTCECDLDNGPSIFRANIVKARKQYKCYECHSIIEIGEQYEYIFGVWNGESDVFHTCEKCADLRDSMEELGFCPTYGELLADHKEYLNEYVPRRR